MKDSFKYVLFHRDTNKVIDEAMAESQFEAWLIFKNRRPKSIGIPGNTLGVKLYAEWIEEQDTIKP